MFQPWPALFHGSVSTWQPLLFTVSLLPKNLNTLSLADMSFRLGSPRGTKDVDVVVKKPLFNGFEKVKQAFVDDSEFRVFDGNRTDGIRAIHMPSSVGIDIMLQ